MHSESARLAKNLTYTAVDFETTGTMPQYPDQPWQIGMVKIEAGSVSLEHTYVSYLRVGARPFNPHAPGRHLRVREQLKNAPDILDIWTDIRPWTVGTPLLAHNVATEKKWLSRTAPLERFGPWIDTLKLARRIYPQEPSFALEDLCQSLGLTDSIKRVCPDREPHDALYDAVACGLLFLHVMHLDGWGELTLEGLQQQLN